MTIQHSFFKLCILSLFVLSACPSDDNKTDNPSSKPSTLASQSLTSSAKPSHAQSSATVQRGIFIYGDEFQIFKACGQNQDVWLQDTVQKDFQKQYKALKLMELEPVYVELEGVLKPTAQSNGFAVDYKQTMHASKLHRLSPWVSDGACFATDFVATGTTPDWTLQILRDGDVYFKSNEGEFPFVDTLAYNKPKQEGNRWQYEFRFRTPDPETLKAQMTEESCSFQGKSYGFKAQIEFRGVTYTGCAKKIN
jgi:uncharacterized membrane protein